MRSRIMVRFGGEDAEDLGPSTRTSSSSRTIGERGWIEEKRDSGHNQKSFFVTLRLEKPWESLPRRGYTTQPGVSTPGTGLGVRFSAHRRAIHRLWQGNREHRRKPKKSTVGKICRSRLRCSPLAGSGNTGVEVRPNEKYHRRPACV
jgi:hypothetical protein